MDEIKQLLKQAVKSATGEDVDIQLARPESEFGDLATNVALILGKKLSQNPREVAKKIIDELPKDSIVEKSEIAGPGFINLTLTTAALWEFTKQQVSQNLKDKVIVAEYSDPNPFKVLHAGHLYTTLVGDSIANLLESAGAKVHRVNFGGDVGLHVGKTMWVITRYLDGKYPEKLQDVDSANRSEWLSQRYVEGNEAYENDQTAKQEINETNKKVYQLHESNDHDSPFAQIYWTTRQWSYDGFADLYQKLQVKEFDKYYPESQTTKLGLESVKTAKSKGVLVESQGAIVFKSENDELHTRVFLTSEGLPTYEAKDLGLALTKWNDYKFDTSLMITGNDIVEYMKVVLKVLSSIEPEIPPRTKHLTHGMVKLAGGEKMSSRRGNVLRAVDIIKAAQDAAKEVGHDQDQSTTLGAVKYALLKQRLGGDIIYDPKESISIEGNSGPYLQYAHARACSVIAKASKKPETEEELEADERALLNKIGQFKEVIDEAVNELAPHRICTYLYELAQAFNSFYEKNRVVGHDREAVRLKLVEAYRHNLSLGLKLLGIEAPEKM